MTKILLTFVTFIIIFFFFLNKRYKPIAKQLIKKILFLFVFMIVIVFLYFKFCNRTIPLEFNFERIQNDSIFFSSNKNLEEYGKKMHVIRNSFICPISNNDLGFPDQSNSEVVLEYDLEYYTKKLEYKLVAGKINNKFIYRTLISIRRNNEIYKKSTLSNDEIIRLIKKKGDSLECNIAAMFYFFPPPKYSPVFKIPSIELINYLKKNKNLTSYQKK